MPKSPSPWSVKGVDPEAREAAKIAARRAGMTVGAWLSQMIRQTASEQLRGRGQRTQQPTPEQPDRAAPTGYPDSAYRDHGYGERAVPPGYGTPYEEFGPRHQQPQQHQQVPRGEMPPGSAPPPAPTMQAVFESIQRLSSRIEESEKRTADTIAPIAEKVSELSEKIEDAKGADGMSTAPVERAMQRIAERLERIEEREEGSARPAQTSQSADRRGLFGLFRRDR